MTDQPQNSLNIEQILEIAGKVENWDASCCKNLEEVEGCWGRINLDKNSIFCSFGITLKPNKSYFLKKLESIDLYINYRDKNSSELDLAHYYKVDWPAAISLYLVARENAFKRNLQAAEKRKQEGIDYAKSILGEKIK